MNVETMGSGSSASASKSAEAVHWPSVKALLYAFLVMDFRNQAFGQVTRTGDRDIFSPLYWVTGQNLLISCFVAGILFARVEAYAFALICLGVSMLVCVTSIIVEFNEIILSPDDLHVLGHQPVSYKTYAVARLANLFLYIAYIILTMSVVPMILGAGLRESTPWFAALYAMASVVGSFLAAGCIILFYVTFFTGPSEKVRETLAWSQAVLMLITGYGGQAVLRDTRDQLEVAVYHLPEWTQWTPPGLLGRFVVSSNNGIAGVEWWILGAATGLTALVWFLVYANLARAYARLPAAKVDPRSTMLPPLKTPGDLFGGITRRLLSDNPDEQSAYWLCRTMLGRDHNLRMRIWPTFGITIAFLGIGFFTGELVDPLLVRGQSVAITLTAIYSLVLPLPTIWYGMRFSKEHPSAWILSAAPISDAAAFARGIEKAILIWVMLPFLAVLTLVLAAVWNDPVHVGLHVAAATMLVIFSAFFSSGLIFRQIPFSQPLGRGEMLGPVAPLLAAAGSVAMLLGGLHYLASARLSWFCGYLLLLAVITVATYFHSRRVIRRRCNLEWFHDEG
ncbi:MAG: hypothetical protein AAFU85_25925 [Planctomycetota bacterium]